MKIKGFPKAEMQGSPFILRADRTNVCSFDRHKNLNFIEARNFYNRGNPRDFNTLKFGTLTF